MENYLLTTEYRASAGPGLPSAAAWTLSKARRWSIVSLLFASALLNYLDRATIAVALPVISAELALGPTAKGLLLSAFFWPYSTMQVPVGWIVDRSRLRWFYAAMFALWSISCGLAGFAGSLATLIALRIALGMGESIFLPAATKIVSSLFVPKDRGLPSGIFISGTRAGLALGAPLIAWFVVQFDWRKMFVIIGFTALFWLIPWLLIFPRELPNGSRKPRHSTLERAPLASRAWRFNRDLLGLCAGMFCLNYYFYPLITWLPEYFVEVRKLTVFQAGLYASLSYAIFGLSEPMGGWVADRLISIGWNEMRVRKGVITAGFLAGVLLIPALLASRWPIALAFLAGASLVGLCTGNLWGSSNLVPLQSK